MLSEVSQRKINTVGYHLSVESKKHNKLVNITEKQTHTYEEQTGGFWWRGPGRGIQGKGTERYRLLGVRWAQGCTAQHGEYSQYFVITKWKVTSKIL